MHYFFSVIIPLFNKEIFINDTINSALNQTFKDFEIIIVNDGSTDNSLNIVKTFKDSRISIYNTENQGVSAARNFGIKKAKADYICLLDADDLWKPSHLQDLKELIEKHPECGLYCKAYEKSFFDKAIINNTFYGIENHFFGIVPDYFLNSTIDEIAWTSAVAFPKNIIDKYGGFDISLRSGQDTDFWVRIALNEKVAFFNKISAVKVISEKGNHLSLSNKRIDRVKILNKYKSLEANNPSFKKYMDLNRFSIAIERKINKDNVWKTIVKDIDLKNLNYKQKILLKSPKQVIVLLKHIQNFLLKKNMYLSAFK